MNRRATICFPFTGDEIGGSHISALGLINGLDPARYRVLIVPQYPDGAIARLYAGHEIVSDPGLRWNDFPPGEAFTPAKFAKTLSSVRPLARFLRRHGVDIVHSNDGRTHATWGLAARVAGARLLWHHRGDPEAIGIRWLAPLIADRIAAVSRFALPAGRFWPAKGRARVVHSPFDTSLSIDRAEARAALLRETGLDPRTLVLGYFGNFIARKRPLLFIETVARVQALMPDRPVAGLMFGVANDPRMAEAMAQEIATRGAAGLIRLMGWQSPGAFWIAGCDQLIVPAVNEPFGRTLVEAMLVGTPVVATRSGGNVEALRDGALGLLVPPEDAGALAEACVRLADDPVFSSAMSGKARQDARTRFGNDLHCTQIAALYDSMLG